MVGKSKKMKVSISLENEDFGVLRQLVETKTAANLSHAVRICIEEHRQKQEVTH